MTKLVITFLVIGHLFLFADSANARQFTEDLIANHYEVTMPEGDAGTLYLSRDGSLIFMPFITNSTYHTNCWGEWKIAPKTQKLIIEDANRCQVLNGAYRLEKTADGYKINDFGKTFTLRKFHKL